MTQEDKHMMHYFKVIFLQFSLLFLMLFNSTLTAQEWSVVNIGSVGFLRDVHFKTSSEALLFGARYIDDAENPNGPPKGYGIILQTENGGANWEEVTPLNIPGLYTSCFTSPSDGCVGGHKGVVIVTRDGGDNWSVHYHDTLFRFLDMSFITTDSGFAVISEDRIRGLPRLNHCKIVRTYDGGVSWEAVGPDNLKLVNKIHAFDDMSVILTTKDGKIYRTTDGFYSLDSLIFQKSNDEHYYDITSLEFFDSKHHGKITTYGGALLYTDDGGETWGEQKVISSNNDTLTSIFSLCFLNPDTGWVVNQGKVIAYTENAGLTWDFDTLSHMFLTLRDVVCTDSGTGILLADLPHYLYREQNSTQLAYAQRQIASMTSESIALSLPYRSNNAIRVVDGTFESFHVYSLNGERLYSMSNTEGLSRLLWNGRNTNGTMSSAGNYCFTFQVNDGTRSRVVKKVVSFLP